MNIFEARELQLLNDKLRATQDENALLRRQVSTLGGLAIVVLAFVLVILTIHLL